MNERIRELADEAGFMDSWFSESGDDCERELKKFAELIVAECGNWFNNRLVVEPDYGIEHRIERNRAVVGVMKEFNQHFGVEEVEQVEGLL
jgi:hypothetical protein